MKARCAPRPADDAPVFAALADLVAAARRHTVGAVMYPEDMAGLYRRAARLHGCAAADLEIWWADHPAATLGNAK